MSPEQERIKTFSTESSYPRHPLPRRRRGGGTESAEPERQAAGASEAVTEFMMGTCDRQGNRVNV